MTPEIAAQMISSIAGCEKTITGMENKYSRLTGGCIFLQIVVSRAGLEPATHWLKGRLSESHPVTALKIY